MGDLFLLGLNEGMIQSAKTKTKLSIDDMANHDKRSNQFQYQKHGSQVRQERFG